jgi:hypothetical protein
MSTKTQFRISIGEVNEHGSVAAAIAAVVSEKCGEVMLAEDGSAVELIVPNQWDAARMSMVEFAAYVAAAQWPQGLIDLGEIPNQKDVSEEIESDQTVYLE